MSDLGQTDLRLMQGLAQEVTALNPALLNGDATIGELAWVWAKDVDALGAFWRHRMWFVDGRLAGWGWACLPHRIPRGDGRFREAKTANLTWQTHPDRPQLLPEILAWYDEVAGDVDRLMIVQSADLPSQATVAEHGYRFDAEAGSDDGDWHQFNARDLTDVPHPTLPVGFRFLAANDVSPADAAKAHRDAWQSANLTDAAFERVRRTWPYRADLQPLIASPDGALVATAIIWFDELTKTAEFEPVGVHPDFRRRGLGAALQLHGMQLARAVGARQMLVACIGASARPAARNLYYSVGFRELAHDLPQIKIVR